MPRIIPQVIDQIGSYERSADIYSRLLEDRIIFLDSEIDDAIANSVVAQLLYLESKDSTKDISLYINSPGGSVTAGLAIYDTIKFLKCDVSTICIGLAASMGAFILAAGTKGKRFALKNSTIMLHQASGGTEGNIQDQRVRLKYTEELNERLLRIEAANIGKSYEELLKATERDFYMFADEAQKYGVIDKVIEKR